MKIRCALFFRVKTHQPRRNAQKVAEPLGGNRPHVVGAEFLTPQAHAGRRLYLVQRNMQRQHAGRPQHHVVMPELRPHQRQARQLALGQKGLLFIHHHPGAVKFQAGFGEDGLLHRHPGAGLDRVDKQPRNQRADMGLAAQRRAAW